MNASFVGLDLMPDVALDTDFESPLNELLCIILDLNTYWWVHDTEFHLPALMEAVMAFAKMYLSMSSSKRLAVLAVAGETSQYVYNTEMRLQDQPQDIQNGLRNCIKNSSSFKLRFLDAVMHYNVCKLVQSASTHLNPTVNLSGAFIKALCYYKRLKNEHQGPQAKSDLLGRFLVIRTSAVDNNACFMSMMNGVFSAQKLNICVDVCILQSIESARRWAASAAPVNGGVGGSGGDSMVVPVASSVPTDRLQQQSGAGLDRSANILRQSADMTGGIYLVVSKAAELLQYLVTLFMCDQLSRQSVMTTGSGFYRSDGHKLPTVAHDSNDPDHSSEGGVDYRASCFCHGRLISVGFVCSLCLAVFCSYSPVCRCCQALFKDRTLTQLVQDASEDNSDIATALTYGVRKSINVQMDCG